MNNEIMNKLNKIILDTVHQKDAIVTEEQIAEEKNVDLYRDFGIDSLLMVYLVVEIENELGIEFNLDELDTEKMRQVNELRRLVENKLG